MWWLLQSLWSELATAKTQEDRERIYAVYSNMLAVDIDYRPE
jgi:hypothetical protein